MKTNNVCFNIILFIFIGALLPFAFAPINLFFLAPILLAILFYFSIALSLKKIMINWYLFGLGFFSVGIPWVYISIHRFGGSNFIVAGLLTIVLVAVCALFFLLQGYISFKFYQKNNFLKLTFILPALWVLCEWFRSWVFTGFPWLLLGYSQSNSFLKGYAPIFGIYGVTFFTALSAGLTAAFFLYKKNIKIISIILLILIWILGFYLTKISWTTPSNKSLKIAIIQGNISQKIKWSKKEVLHTMQIYKNLSQNQLNKNLIIWPEAAVTLPIPYSNDYLQKMSTLAKNHNTSLIVGVPVETNDENFYNAAIGLGNAHGIYYKRHLLPFGDYVPLERLLRGIISFFDLPMSGFKAGNDKQNLINVAGVSVGVYICYEVAYASLVRSDLPKAQILLTLSDDAWFGDSFALGQHLQIGQMRALENGRYMIFSSNNGITAIIDPNGVIVKTAPKFARNVLTGNVYAMYGATPWTQIGSTPLIITIFLLLFICIIQERLLF